MAGKDPVDLLHTTAKHESNPTADNVFPIFLKRFAYHYLQAFPSVMSYTNKTWKKIYDFVYYRLTLLGEVCFNTVTRYKINPFNEVWLENQQLILPCLKNGGM